MRNGAIFAVNNIRNDGHVEDVFAVEIFGNDGHVINLPQMKWLWLNKFLRNGLQMLPDIYIYHWLEDL